MFGLVSIQGDVDLCACWITMEHNFDRCFRIDCCRGWFEQQHPLQWPSIRIPNVLVMNGIVVASVLAIVLNAI